MINNSHIANNLAINMDKLIVKLGFENKKILLVSDERIFQNCAKFFGRNLEEVCAKTLILTSPKADEENLQKVEKAALGFDLILALGSGTISDLCKLTSAKNNIPYAIFASAPSMNGYLSKNASILMKGHKKTLPATLPIAVFCDLEILKSAPENLIQAGIGDSLCFYSCWFDWYLSHALLGTYFDENLFKILEKKMRFLVQNYTKFSLRDEELLTLLIEILLISGDSMTKAGGSYPASQSEHLIAHVLEMKYPKEMSDILHGEQIAVTTLTCASLQEELLESCKERQPKFILENDCEDRLVKYLGKEVAMQCTKEFNQKINIVKQSDSCEKWPYEKLSEILFKASDLKKIFQHFRIKTSSNYFSLSKEQYQEAISCAKFIRNRFTCLDLFLKI